jgi:hypothetical protein
LKQLSLPSAGFPKMETYSSEASVDIQRATRRYIPEDRTINV